MKVRIFVDGKQVPLNDFVSKMIWRTTMGVISSLKHVDRPSRITIELEVDEEDYYTP